jgi:flagellar biosynthetic protein FliO
MNTSAQIPAVTDTSGVLGGSADFQSAVQIALSFALVVGAVLLFTWVVRRITRLQSNALGGLRVVGGLSVGMRERIVLLEAGDQQLLVGVAPGFLRTLHVFDRPLHSEETAFEEDRSFLTRLERALRG